MSHPEIDKEHGDEHAIAVIGLSGCFPAAPDLDTLWRNLVAGEAAMRGLSEEELLAAKVPGDLLARPDYVRVASAIEGIEDFDADFFGYSPGEAALLDPQQRLFLEHAWGALEDAGVRPNTFEGSIGVYAGVAWNTYLLSNLMAHRELFDGASGFQVFITNDKDFMPTRVAYKLDLKGPAVNVQTSCSTSLVATHLACLGLLSYECDLALAGGVTVKVPSKSGYVYQEGGLASPDGRCRSFDAKAAGTIFGSGIGIVALKRLADARADGDSIRAVIRGSAINNDGALKVSYTAPSVEGQAEVIAAAQAMAGVDPETIGYVECHGTATALGDPIEVRALTKVFRDTTAKKGFCALGSIKANLGHLDAAAGVAGLIKTVLALERRTIPPVAGFESPNPALELDASPFWVPREAVAWPAEPGVPRRAGVSSFGVGGTNAHLILEEAPPSPPPSPSRRWQLLRLSARSPAALETAAARLAEHLETEPAPLADVAHTLRVGRAVFRQRRIALTHTPEEACAALAGERPELVFSAADGAEPRARPVAFLFSGQGSQYLGMGRGLYEEEPVFRALVDAAAEQLRPLLGEDLRAVMWPTDGGSGEAARLERTCFAQPALLTLELALAELWRSWGVVPAAMLGHSIGELAAATIAGVMQREEALALVAARGRLMDALPAGAMLAVPLAEDELLVRLARHPELALAAINEPARTVVSGPEPAIAAFAAELAAEGIDSRGLHTSHAFHSAMMDPILDAFTAEARKIRLRAPEIPFVSNLTGTWITAAEATDPDYWARHLRSPVRFADGVALLAEEGERVFLEVGPGRALATLAGRHPARRVEQPVLTSLRHPQDNAQGIGEDQATMLASLGRLWLAGVALDDAALDRDETRRRVPLPSYPFERRRYWIEPGETPATPVGTGKRPDLADWFYLPAWRPALAPRLDLDALPASWWILARPGGLGAALAARLEAAGRRVQVVAPGDDLERLAQNGLPDAIVHAWALDGAAGPEVTTAAAFDAAQAAGFGSLLALARLLASRALPPEGIDLLVVADGLARIVESEPLRPEKAPLLGLLRVLPEEVPGVRCRAIDTALPAPGSAEEARLAERLLAELTDRDTELVALRGRQRWLEAFEPVRLPAEPGRLREGGVYALTGGLQGNGYAFASYLARTLRPRLVLIEDSIRKTPGTFDPERIARLEALGAEILVVTADVAEPAGWNRALDDTEARFGALHGILHTAGTDGEATFRTLAEIDAEHLAGHFRPKVHATLALAAALEQRLRPDLELCLLLSSLATVLGGLAYGAYAAANSFLDAFARAHAGALPLRGLGWDVWQFEDESTQITQLRADLADLAMTVGEGERAFERWLGTDTALLLVSTADLQTRRAARRERIARHLAPAVAPTGTQHPRPQLQTSFAAPETELEHKIAGVWREFLGFETIGIDDNFFELGGDSFIAVRVAARLKEVLATEVPVAQLYQRLTVRSLAELLSRDAETTTQELAEKLAERRESMDRRRDLLERRRGLRRGER